MKIQKSDLGIIQFEHDVFGDDRGETFEAVNNLVFSRFGFKPKFKQGNFSYSKRGALRGIHYQVPPQGKLVTLVSGVIYDVSIDLDSGQVFQRILDKPGQAVWIPPTMAHGFYSISGSIVYTMMTQYYKPNQQIVIAWNDPKFDIDWPISQESTVILSEQDDVRSEAESTEPDF